MHFACGSRQTFMGEAVVPKLSPNVSLNVRAHRSMLITSPPAATQWMLVKKNNGNDEQCNGRLHSHSAI